MPLARADRFQRLIAGASRERENGANLEIAAAEVDDRYRACKFGNVTF